MLASYFSCTGSLFLPSLGLGSAKLNSSVGKGCLQSQSCCIVFGIYHQSFSNFYSSLLLLHIGFHFLQGHHIHFYLDFGAIHIHYLYLYLCFCFAHYFAATISHCFHFCLDPDKKAMMVCRYSHECFLKPAFF